MGSDRREDRTLNPTAHVTAPPIPSTPRLVAAVIDYGERALLVLLYLLLVENLLPSLGRQPTNTLLLLSESIVVGFVIFRRRSAKVTTRALDWALALGGTVCPLFMRSGGHPLGPPALAAALMTKSLTLTLTPDGARLSLIRPRAARRASSSISTLSGKCGTSRKESVIRLAMVFFIPSSGCSV